MTELELAVEHLRMTTITARSIDATQSVVNIHDLTTVLDELDRAHTQIQELTDRVLADIHHKSDAEDLRRELDTMRCEWGGVSTGAQAIATLRDQMRDWFPKYEVGAISVAMPAATAMKLLEQLDEWRTQVDTLLAREAQHPQAHQA